MNCVHVTCNGNNLWGIYEARGGVEENGKEEQSQFSQRTKREAMFANHFAHSN